MKAKAWKKAKSEGITLKAVLSHALKLYTEGKLEFSLKVVNQPEVELIEPTPEIQKKMDKLGRLLEKL